MISWPDTRGTPSRTLPFVAISWLVVTVKFLIAGMTLGPLGEMPQMDAGAYGSAVALILAIWVGREWKQKSMEANRGNT